MCLVLLQNILVVGIESSGFHRVKVADFGLTKHTKGTQLHSAHTGTNEFMAPEILQDEKHIPLSHPRAVDIWALGAIAFFACVGRLPFRNKFYTRDYALGRIEFPESALSGFSRAFADFVLVSMAIIPARRPTAEEVLKHTWVHPSASYVDRRLYKP